MLKLRDSHLHWRAAHTCPGRKCRGVSVATTAPSHRPEAVSLRESDMVFLRQVLISCAMRVLHLLQKAFLSAILQGNLKPVLYQDRKSTRLNSSHLVISYAVFCLKKKKPHD